ncbi:hypothetical protein QRX50_31705 [Amycolatopsis carbonis]|uniref:Uncharacterized protein n=1 Tax=Amycolatopsis carbonis TaxID=715471 RepID=A0A9Y2IBN6_9PSEU|nr:hypothetical protein [Amycolatopsis sp. 2-15]WIX76026.1 hypothetical protein QRX50_31705 [Amycolatopsis sp. 2-15]
MSERTMRVLDAQTATQHVATGSAAAGTGFAGSISLILVWGLGQLGVHLPAEVAAAIVAVLMTAAGVYAPKLAIAKLAAGFIDVPHVAADVVKGTVDGATKQVGGAVGAVAVLWVTLSAVLWGVLLAVLPTLFIRRMWGPGARRRRNRVFGSLRVGIRRSATRPGSSPGAG